MRLANSDAGARGQAPPIAQSPDAEGQLASVVTQPRLLLVVRDDRDTGELREAPGTESRPARRWTTFAHRPSEGWRLGSFRLLGTHAVIARHASGYPRGEHEGFPTAQRSTLFRPPAPWDRGTERATPGV